jgi:hypothetical protein
MDVLKRIAARNFTGGTKPEERDVVIAWIDGCEGLLVEEERREKEEVEQRRKWEWTTGDWSGPERELLFLKCFDPEPNMLPQWDILTESTPLPTPFLKEMQTGLRLITLHNSIVRSSHRTFGQIPVFHTDTQKPYRAAENLRFWIKAAELRWEVFLKVDVMGVVYGTDEKAWRDFDEAIKIWCCKLRQEMSGEVTQLRRARTMPV